MDCLEFTCSKVPAVYTNVGTHEHLVSKLTVLGSTAYFLFSTYLSVHVRRTWAGTILRVPTNLYGVWQIWKPQSLDPKHSPGKLQYSEYTAAGNQSGYKTALLVFRIIGKSSRRVLLRSPRQLGFWAGGRVTGISGGANKTAVSVTGKYVYF